MKKRIFSILSIAVLVIGIGVGFLLWPAPLRAEEVTSFDLYGTDEFGCEYARLPEEFPSELLLGPVADAEEAARKAEWAFIDVYGEEVKSQRPYTVAYDEVNKVWLIQGTWHQPLFGSKKGGCASMLIRQEDGKVLALWHGA